MKRTLWIFLVVAICTLPLLASCSKAYEFHGTVSEPAKPAADIVGTNLDGKTFNLHDLQGKVVVAFFGYTNCPDVCPLTLANMNSAYEKLGDKVKDVAFVFVSTDPARDTPQRLADYVPVFNKTFYGVNVPVAALDNVKRGYGVFSEKNKEVQPTDADAYFVDHSGYVYIIDQQGQWRLTYSYDTPVEEIVADIEHLLAG
ncbi:MAG: SCO family protein [Chloroflexi bacterium]|nr:SCO family protein [Chloroflexota bacterium]